MLGPGLQLADWHECVNKFDLISTESTLIFQNTQQYFLQYYHTLKPFCLSSFVQYSYGLPVDWWALGTLMFEMLTGLPPFYSKNAHSMYQKILTAELKCPPYISPDAECKHTRTGTHTHTLTSTHTHRLTLEERTQHVPEDTHCSVEVPSIHQPRCGV